MEVESTVGIMCVQMRLKVNHINFSIERLHVVSLMMSHDVIKFNFHTMSLPILLDIDSCPEKLQIKFESVSSYG